MIGMVQMFKSVSILSLGLLLGGLLMAGETAAAASEPTQTHSGGGVTVKVTYLNPQSSEDARFQVVLDTHSVNLDEYDLKSLSLLRDGTGKTYEAKQVENKGSGHHRQITIVFPKVAPETKKLELVLKEIAGVKERSLRWDLSQ